MKFALLLLSSIVFANETVTATAVGGVTADQIREATEPINMAKFEHNGQMYGVKCAGSDDVLRCEIWSKEPHALVIASGNLKICKIGNHAAIMSEEAGLGGKVVKLPGVVKGSARPDCAG